MTLNHNYGCFSGVGGIAGNGIKLKADRLYKRFGDGGLILGCVSTSVFRVGINKN